jgi:opacity protein-like surface antigen
MHKFLWAGVCLLLLAPVALAQGSDRRVEFFVGYSNLQAEGVPDPNDPNNVFDEDFFDRRRGQHGVNAALAGYFNSVLGLKADFSFHRSKDSTDLVNGRDSVENQTYYFMGGPVLKARNSSRIEPFAHALFGGARTRFELDSRRDLTSGTVRNTFDVGTTDFALAVGGGLDIRLGDRFSIRAIQVDYAPIFLGDRAINVLSSAGALVPFTLEGQRQDNLRISVGIVF